MRHFVFVLLTLVLSACESEHRSTPLPSGRVADFELATISNILDNPWEVVTEGAGTGASLTLVQGGYRSLAYHLQVNVTRPEGASGSQVAGVRTNLTTAPAPADPNRAPFSVDARNYTGLSLALRGEPGSYIIQIGTSKVTDFVFYNAYVSIDGEWTEFNIPFSSFVRENSAENIPLTGDFLTHIAVYPMISGSYVFGIDDVRFY